MDKFNYPSNIIEIRNKSTDYVQYTFDSNNIYQVSFTRKYHKLNLNPQKFILVFDFTAYGEDKNIKRIGLTQHENWVDLAVRTANQGGWSMFSITNELNNILISL